MKNYLNKIFLFITLVIFLTGVINDAATEEKNRIAGASISTKPTSVDVDVFIGEYHFTLFGYSSPQAKISLSGMGIYDETVADKQGYFEFKNRFSPFSPREACLTAQDQFGRLSAPLCLPSFPTSYNITIGPVIMPPTLSLDKNNYWLGDEIIAAGQTIPNSEVDLSIFTQTSSKFHLIKPVNAFFFPALEAYADEKGNFSLALPSSKPETLRLFAQTNFQQNPSSESIKLTFKILPWWMIFIQIFLALFSLIKSRLWEIIITAEIISLAIFFIRQYFHPHIIARQRSLVLREKMAIIKNPTLISSITRVKS